MKAPPLAACSPSASGGSVEVPQPRSAGSTERGANLVHAFRKRPPAASLGAAPQRPCSLDVLQCPLVLRISANHHNQGVPVKIRFVLLGVSVAVLIGITAATGSADPNLAPVPAHRHFINGAQVGPNLCDNPSNVGIQQAFAQFHNNLHRLTPTSIGPVAPGLHNGIGGEITPGSC